MTPPFDGEFYAHAYTATNWNDIICEENIQQYRCVKFLNKYRGQGLQRLLDRWVNKRI